MYKILIVDDSKTLRTELKDCYEKDGYHVIEADSSIEGIKQALANEDVHLVITDYNLGGENGIQFTSKLKSFSQFKHVPILMLTTEYDLELKAQGKAAGLSGWINKPYSHENIAPVAIKLIEQSLKAK
ncbi:MAG: response regulator [Flavobacterium sp.]|nr:MAG: response regulator [Flavobacterium sp.]